MLGTKTAPSAFICARCLRRSQRRLYATNADRTPPLTPPQSGAANLTNRRLLSLHGQDAAKFLQGLVTANIRPESRTGVYTAFLTAPGKVLHDAFVYPTLGSRWHEDVNKNDELGYLVEMDGGQAEGLLKHLKRHKLRSKFKLRLLEEGELGVWQMWREDDRWTAHTKAGTEDGVIGMTDSRAPGMGQRLLLTPTSSSSSRHEALEGVEEAPLSAYTVRRYLKGVAEGQTEIPREESLPMNCNIDLMGGIDFKKGCYVGQELTIRTHHTGVVRRRILPVQLYNRSDKPPEKLQYDSASSIVAVPDHTDVRRDDERGRATGKFITGIANIGLAMCRLEQMSDLVVSGEGTSFNDSDRFTVQAPEDNAIGVRVFVPDWIRGQIREPKLQRRVET